MPLFLNLSFLSSPVTDSTRVIKELIEPLIESSNNGNKFWIIEKFWQILSRIGASDGFATFLSFFAACAILVLLIWITNKLITLLTLPSIKKIATRTKTRLDDIFFENKFFNRILQLIPLTILSVSAETIFAGFSGQLVSLVEIIIRVTIVVVIVRILYASLDSWNDVYNHKRHARGKSIKGYIQVGKIILAIIAGIFIVSIIFKKNPSTLFLGLGTAAALLSFVFKDTILGFVASIQLSAQDMIRIGDWIEMPSKGADGTVLDINISSVKVRNWDNTLTMIPIYSMVTDSFTNWRGMEQSGGRRFTRSFYFNLESVKFVDADFMQRISESKIIADNIERVIELSKKSSGEDTLTNLALMRSHMELFLRDHPKINNGMGVFARYRQDVSDKGVGIELYAFTYGKTSIESEMTQRSIVEYIIAIAPLYEMRIFQSPSRLDFRNVVNS